MGKLQKSFSWFSKEWWKKSSKFKSNLPHKMWEYPILEQMSIHILSLIILQVISFPKIILTVQLSIIWSPSVRVRLWPSLKRHSSRLDTISVQIKFLITRTVNFTESSWKNKIIGGNIKNKLLNRPWRIVN